MNLEPINQTKLYGLSNTFNQFVNLYKEKKLPTKILLSGQKGIGKCTFAYHLINYILSLSEEYSYDLENFSINKENKYFKLNLNGSNPNLSLIDVLDEKKSIDINQIRELINNLNKSSFNSKERFVLIDNIEYLNVNSINALLKVIEEPNENIHFILINNHKKILSTLTSRCTKFNISLSNSEKLAVCKNLLNDDLDEIVNLELVDYYFTPGKIYNLVKFAQETNIDLTTINLKDFINLIINKSLYKKESSIKHLIYDFVELFLTKNASTIHGNFQDYFLNQIDKTKRFNLDEESLFLKLKSELSNG